ncbi:MAG TPA: hypothetical protein VLX85_08810 [Stellaceae bacterium]|nr:hypothetical protein [Stellaceae bacterium]
MKVKIFRVFGTNEANNLEGDINAWLAKLPTTSRVAWTNTTSCAVGQQNQASLVVTIWYEP